MNEKQKNVFIEPGTLAYRIQILGVNGSSYGTDLREIHGAWPCFLAFVLPKEQWITTVEYGVGCIESYFRRTRCR